MTMRMLTAELPNWSHHTCLSLAVIANNKRLLAHPWYDPTLKVAQVFCLALRPCFSVLRKFYECLNSFFQLSSSSR